MELEEESPPSYSLLEMPSTPFVFPSTLPGFKYDLNLPVYFTYSELAYNRYLGSRYSALHTRRKT